MSDFDRRQVLQAMLALIAAGTTAGAEEKPPAEKHASMKDAPKGWHGDEVIGMLIYPQFTALDLFGPHHVLISMMGAKVLLVAKTLEPVATDTGVKIVPTTTFEQCPEKLSVLFVPGGTQGTLAAARDQETREFVANRGAKADWVTSVCTGSLLLGAAGLLNGYKATSHWLTREALRDFGATPVNERVVIDRNRVTGAGVTSGLDFALRLLKDLRGEEYAKTVQLFSEYDPKPPFDCGSPAKSSPETVKVLTDMFEPFGKQIKDLARELGVSRTR